MSWKRWARTRGGRLVAIVDGDRDGRLAVAPGPGSGMPAAKAAFANARAKSESMPMTSPVERISGPRIVSTPGNFTNGNTTSLTDTWRGSTSPCSAELGERLARP